MTDMEIFLQAATTATVCYCARMAPFLYRCPNTGRQVQGFVADDPTEDSDEYQSVTCLACAQSHFVNPSTGKVLGADDE